MQRFKQGLMLYPVLISFGMSLSNQSWSQQREFYGQYYSQTVYAGEIRGSGVNNAVLRDIDLIRGNNEDEAIFSEVSNDTSDPLQLFDGYLVYDTVNFRVSRVDGEASATVFFNDGTTLYDVNAIFDQFISYGVTTARYLLDQNALQAAGKRLSDIVDIAFNERVDHDLNYSDFGFTSSPPSDGNSDDSGTQPPPPNDSNLIIGTDGRDDLRGGNGDEIIRGLGGERDVLAGGGGQDTFVFGAEAGNGLKDKDIIVDFDVIDDTVVLENGAQIASSRINNGTLVLRLKGSDRDIIRLRGIDYNISAINLLQIDGEFE